MFCFSPGWHEIAIHCEPSEAIRVQTPVVSNWYNFDVNLLSLIFAPTADFLFIYLFCPAERTKIRLPSQHLWCLTKIKDYVWHSKYACALQQQTLPWVICVISRSWSRFKFRSHSCSRQLQVESESDSVQCENIYIVQCSHLVCSSNQNRNQYPNLFI